MLAADFNQDGKTDLAVINGGDITDFPTQTLMVLLETETAASHRWDRRSRWNHLPAT